MILSFAPNKPSIPRITSINGRQDTRCYAKTVLRGTSVHNLSDEEEQAIREAMSGRREIAPVR